MTTDEQEEAWIEGRRAAWCQLLGLAVGELRDGVDVTAEALLAEREDVRRILRRICAEHGDNDWPDDLHLGDVLEKHLEPYLEADERGDSDE